tara:strand:+ start:593 stop:1039 length:447 start_codon:yes stop_codon:yes gene_type:complete
METYHYKECGLDNIYLINGVVEIETEEGKIVSFPKAKELHRQIGLDIVKSQSKLSGKEIRFLRVQMELAQKRLGHMIAVEGQTVARWEKEECPITGPAERLLRAIYRSYIHEQKDILEMCEHFAELDEMESASRREFAMTDNEWHVAA